MALAALAQADLKRKIETRLEPEFLAPFRKLIEDLEDFSCPTNEEFLLRFLHARNFNVERSFELLKNYYKLLGGIFGRHSYPSARSDLVDTEFITHLKCKDKLGRDILYIRYENWDASKYSAEYIFPFIIAVFEEMISLKSVQENGLVLVANSGELTMAQVTSFTLRLTMQLASFYNNSFPFKFKGCHLINTPKIFDIVWNVLKNLLSDKIRSRVFFHSNPSDLLEHFDKETLPEKLGGLLTDEEAIDNTFMNGLISKDMAYKERLKYGYQKKIQDDDEEDEEEPNEASDL